MSDPPSSFKPSASRSLPARFFFYILLGAVAAGVLFSLRNWNRRGGDKAFAEEIATRRFSTFYLRSPLTIYLHQAAYHYVFAPLDLSAADAVGACSAVAGGLFVVAIVAMSRHWLFLLFNLCAPLMFVFMGHVEHYAWVTALLAVYYAFVQRHLENSWPLWPALAMLLLAAGFHMLAVFHFPTFLFLLRERDPETREWRWRSTRSEGEILLTIFIVWALSISTAQMAFHVSGLDNGFKRLVPLVMPKPDASQNAAPDAPAGPGAADEPKGAFAGGRYVLFSMFSWAHLKMWLYFHWMSSPLGLAFLVFLVWTIRTRFEKFLLVATGCAFLWTWMWHPDRGRNDWDLFANLALPMNVLVGLLLVRAQQRLWTRWKSRRGAEETDG